MFFGRIEWNTEFNHRLCFSTQPSRQNISINLQTLDGEFNIRRERKADYDTAFALYIFSVLRVSRCCWIWNPYLRLHFCESGECSLGNNMPLTLDLAF